MEKSGIRRVGFSTQSRRSNQSKALAGTMVALEKQTHKAECFRALTFSAVRLRLYPFLSVSSLNLPVSPVSFLCVQHVFTSSLYNIVVWGLSKTQKRHENERTKGWHFYFSTLLQQYSHIDTSLYFLENIAFCSDCFPDENDSKFESFDIHYVCSHSTCVVSWVQEQ